MRRCIDGNGNDSTAAVQAYLASNNELRIRNLIIIGHPEDPFSIWLTDHEGDLTWSYYPENTFKAAVVSRGSVSSKVGFESQSLTINWSPKNRVFTNQVSTASPLQLAVLGFYDNWPVYVWNVYMPHPGDCNTLGASELFGGIVGDISVDINGIAFTVDSFLYVTDQEVPPNVIEATNTMASFLGAQPPQGFTDVPTFQVVLASSTTSFSADCLNPGGHIFSNNTFLNGFVVFTSGPLEGFFSAVSSNFSVPGPHNTFTVYSPFPWPPTIGDQFYVSVKSPVDQTDTSAFYGFPYVPDPTQAL